MHTARIGKEIVVRMKNEIGALARLSRAVADKGVNILAACAWVEGADGVIHLVTEDNLRSVETLTALGCDARESDVVIAELAHKPGMLRGVTERLAGEKIDIHHLYASAGISQDRCLLILASANNDRAVVLLNEQH